MTIQEQYDERRYAECVQDGVEAAFDYENKTEPGNLSLTKKKMAELGLHSIKTKGDLKAEHDYARKYDYIWE